MSATTLHPAWLHDAPVAALVAALGAGGRPFRFVGGAVRDSLRDPAFVPSDIDVATADPPERAAELLRAGGFTVVPTGLAHGTVTAVGHGGRFEVTTLRHDVETDGRHAKVAWTDDFDADAARRDFTVNALSLDPDGTLHDPFGGIADLAAGRIRFVGEPATRIAEDRLRILRWFRFLASHGRPPADPDALAACAEGAPGLDALAGERLRAELLRLLVAPGAAWSVALMAESGVLTRLTGPLGAPFDATDPADSGPAGPGDPRAARLAALIAAAPDADALLRLAVLVEPANAAAVGLRLRLSRDEAAHLVDRAGLLPLAPPTDAPVLRRLVDAEGGERIADRLRLDAARHGRTPAHAAAIATASSWTPPAFPVGGDDLLATGLSPGPQLGRTLAELRAWWVAHDFAPDRARCLAELGRRLGSP